MKIWRLGSVALHCLTCATWHDGNGGDPMAWPCTAPRACCTRGLQDGARALIVEGPKGLADGAKTLSFAALDASGFLLSAQQEPGRIRCGKRQGPGTIGGFLQFIHGEGQHCVLGENYDLRASGGSIASAPPRRAAAGTPALRGASALALGGSSGSLREALPSAFPRQEVWRGRPEG